MEVKIKDQDKLVDATIEMVDGVMVVSPKNVYVPKDGDVVMNSNFVFIYRDALTVEAYYYVACNIFEGSLILDEGKHIGFINQLRLANDSDRDILFKAIDQEGYEWLADEKKLVKKEWKPKYYEYYYFPSFSYIKVEFKPESDINQNCEGDIALYEKGWVFRTEEECQQLCDKLNEVIDSIKP